MSKIEALRQHLMRLYNEHLAAGMLPTSNWFLFYELVGREIVEKHPPASAAPTKTRSTP